jgi:hypothetical protein
VFREVEERGARRGLAVGGEVFFALVEESAAVLDGFERARVVEEGLEALEGEVVGEDEVGEGDTRVEVGEDQARAKGWVGEEVGVGVGGGGGGLGVGGG